MLLMISAVEFTDTTAGMPDHVQHVVLLHVSGAGGTGQRNPSVWVNMLVLGHHVGNYCVVVRLDRKCSWHLNDMVQALGVAFFTNFSFTQMLARFSFI